MVEAHLGVEMAISEILYSEPDGAVRQCSDNFQMMQKG